MRAQPVLGMRAPIGRSPQQSRDGIGCSPGIVLNCAVQKLNRGPLTYCLPGCATWSPPNLILPDGADPAGRGE